MNKITIENLAEEAANKWSIDAGRLGRAVKLASTSNSFYNKNLPAGQWNVRGSNGWYLVDTKSHTCSCKDSQLNHICKHRLALWLYVQVITRNLAAARRCPPEQIIKELGYQ